MGSGVGHSLNAIVEVIRRVTGAEVSVKYTERRSFDVPAIYLDIDRAEKELSWAPSTTLEAGISRTWEFVKGIV
jgi:UDP-glucose 4-epimerase